MLPESFTNEFLRQLELVKIRSRRQFLGTKQGGHISLKRGHGIEFSDYRQYELGDNPRHIDWGVYARSDRLYVKKYQEEQDLNIFIILDTSSSMFTPSTDNKWQLARDIAIALAYVALIQQDNVHILAPGYFVSPPYFGARSIHHLSKELLALEFSEGRDFWKDVRQVINRIRFPGVAIVLSDFMYAEEETRWFFNLLRARNLDLSAIQVLGPNDIEPYPNLESARFVDSESGEEVEVTMSAELREDYGALLVEHNAKLKDFLASAQVSYSQALTTHSLSDFVINNLSRTGLLS